MRRVKKGNPLNAEVDRLHREIALTRVAMDDAERRIQNLHSELGDLRLQNAKLTEKLADTEKQRNAIAWELVATALPEVAAKIPRECDTWRVAVSSAPHAWGLRKEKDKP